jgi:dinuclear metal center YbgI/SA1388 family protein
MTRVHEIAAYLDSLLETGSTPDYPGALNGLQLENGSEVRAIAAAVDFSSRAIEGAIENDANLLIVHHGMFWGGASPLTGPTYRRIQRLLDKDIAIYSSHLPLDRHSTFGNNVLLAKQLGLKPTGSFAKHGAVSIGVSGESDVDTHVIAERARTFAADHGGILRSTPITSTRRTRRWAICTGAGASAETLKEAEELEIDTLVVGEGPHWTAIHAEELGLVIIYAGHYATETLGVRAIAEHVAQKYAVRSSFVRAPTGL